jgi:hypothetical protein
MLCHAWTKRRYFDSTRSARVQIGPERAFSWKAREYPRPEAQTKANGAVGPLGGRSVWTTVNDRADALAAAFALKASHLRATVCPGSTRPTACAPAGSISRLVEVGFPSARTHGGVPWSETGP